MYSYPDFWKNKFSSHEDSKKLSIFFKTSISIIGKILPSDKWLYTENLGGLGSHLLLQSWVHLN